MPYGLLWKCIQSSKVVALVDLHIMEELTVVIGGGLRCPTALLFYL